LRAARREVSRAERLGTNRNALYKTLHDARLKLRAVLADRGFAVEEI